MRRLLRGARLLAQLAFSAVSCGWFLLARRGATLVFTHAPDVDAEWRDPQMGPLVEGLLERGRPIVEVAFIPLDGGLLANLARTRRPHLAHAALLASARLLALAPGWGRERARLAVGRALLRALRPRAVYLVDESGSGQLLLRAARSLGTPAIGIQHGDFQPANPQYARPAGVEPADVLCVWSPWFRRRLLAVSPIYTEANTRVTGRLRFPAPRAAPPGPGAAGRLRILVVAERAPGWRAAAEPYLEAVRGRADLELQIQPHPADGAGDWPAAELAHGSLARALLEADVVCGTGSSALLEALWHGRPAVSLVVAGRRDPAGYAAAGLVEPCADPKNLPALCRELARGGAERTEERRARVWGGAADDPVAAILACEAPRGGL